MRQSISRSTFLLSLLLLAPPSLGWSTGTANANATVAAVPDALTTPRPTLSNVQVTNVTPTGATVSWDTDVLSDSFLAWYTADFMYMDDTGPQDGQTGTLHHSLQITNGLPQVDMGWFVRSRGFTNGIPDPLKVQFNGNADVFYTGYLSPAAPATGPLNLDLRGKGPHHVFQGYDVIVGIPNALLSGNDRDLWGQEVDYTISNLPPHTAIHWPDPEWNGSGQWWVNPRGLQNTVKSWGPAFAQFDLETNVGGTTPTGRYTLTITAYMPNAVPNPYTKSITWDMTVDPAPAFHFGTPASYPVIPDLDVFKAQMVTYGHKWCGTATRYDQTVSFYDGTRTYYEIKDYDAGHNLTGNPSQWDACAEQVNQVYSDWVIELNGHMQGWWTFPKGPYMAYQRTGNTDSRSAVHLLGSSSNFAPLSYYPYSEGMIREYSYQLNAFRYDSKLGNGHTQQMKEVVTDLLGMIDQVVHASDEHYFNQSFMDGLVCEALIDYYNDGHQDDLRIPAAVKAIADHLWNDNWNRADFESGAFVYNDYLYSVGMQQGGNEWRGLNLMDAPVFAWLFSITGNQQYQVRADAVWHEGVTANPGSTVGWSGKNFNQNYRWAFDFIKWRSGPPPPPPNAAFTFAPGNPGIGQVVTFTDTSTGGPTSWFWDFGDTGSSTLENPSHTFLSTGTYPVKLTVFNSNGDSQASHNVTVSPPPPPPVSGPTKFNVVTPCRVLDTRNAPGPLGGPSIGAGGSRSFVATGICNVPSGTVAISANVTVVNPAAAGDLIVYPNGVSPPPPASTVSFRRGRTLANNSIVYLASDGSFLVKNNAPGALDLVLDVNGYFK